MPRCLEVQVLSLWKYLTTRWLAENDATHGMHYSYEYYPLSKEPNTDPGFDLELCLRINVG